MKNRLAPAHWLLFLYALALLVVQPLRLDSFFTPTWPEGLARDFAMVWCMGAGFALLSALGLAGIARYTASKRVGVCGLAAMLVLVAFNIGRVLSLLQPATTILVQVLHFGALVLLLVYHARACDAKQREVI